MRITRREKLGGVRGRRSREVLVAEPLDSSNTPLDPEKDLPKWRLEELSRSNLAALARLKPEIGLLIREQVGRDNLTNAVPGNYSIEDYRGNFSFAWLLWAADNIQIFPEMRKQEVPGLNKTYEEVVFQQINQSARPDTTKAPFELNLALYYKAFLELCPGKRSEILSQMSSKELRVSVEMYLNGEFEEHTNEFTVDPDSGWVQGFAAAKALFPDLAERITELFGPHWGKMKEIIKGMKSSSLQAGYVLSVGILAADSAWIDETGEFHIEFNQKKGLNPTKSLPERSTV